MITRELAIRQALARLLKPLIRLLLRNGIAFAEFAEVARKAYVDVAAEDFAVPGRKQTHSRIAVLTGIHRREVNRLREMEEAAAPPTRKRNRAARVIAGWLDDPDFSIGEQPKELSIAEDFTELVRRHGGDIPARAVLDELLRVGAIERSGEESVKLVVEVFSSVGGDVDWFALLGESTADLLSTLDHNFAHSRETSRLQLTVAYDHIPDEALQTVRTVSHERSMAFLHELNRFFRTQDKDSNADLSGEGRHRAGIGLYYFEHPVEVNDEST
ncbi:MAG: DUF6502 family protein [Granulosicoccaceae bacterium]